MGAGHGGGMTERATSEALRQAAGELDGAGVPGAPLMAKAIRARHTLPPDDHAQNAMAALATLATYLGEPAGAAWLAQAARLRLLVEAAVAEGIPSKQGALEDVVWGWWQEVYRDG